MTSEGATGVPRASRFQLQKLRRRLASGESVDGAALETLRRRHPDWYAPLLLGTEKALQEGDGDALRHCLAQADAAWPDSLRAHYLRALVLQETGKTEEALRSAALALQRPAHGQALVAQAAEMIWRLGGRRALRAAPLHESTPADLPPRALLRLIRAFHACGDAGRTEALAGVLSRRAPELAAELAAAVSVTHPAGPGGDVDWDADFIGIPSPGSDTAIVVFSGIKHEAGMALEALYEELKPLRCHFVGLRDMSRMLFMGAHPALGVDPVECAMRLRERVQAMGARRIVLLGNSAGAIGALLYGALMKADGIVGYGAITDVEAPFETRGRSVARRIRRLAPGWLAPPGKRLAKCSPAIPVLLYFGAGMDIDRMHAEHLASVPGVRLRPVLGFSGHNVLPQLVPGGVMRSELEAFLGLLRNAARPRAELA